MDIYGLRGHGRAVWTRRSYVDIYGLCGHGVAIWIALTGESLINHQEFT